MTATEAIAAFDEFCRQERYLKETTRDVYTRQLRRFARAYPDRFPEDITRMDINEHVGTFVAHNELNTARSHQTVIRLFFKWFTERVRPDLDNPAANVKQIREETKIPNVPAPSEIMRMIYSCDLATHQGRRDAALMALLADTGIRRGECERLKVGNVIPREDHMLLIVPRVKTHERQVPFCKLDDTWLMSEIFLSYWMEITTVGNELTQGTPFRPTDPLFMADGVKVAGGAIRQSGIYTMVRKYARKAGLTNISPHSFRHYYGTYSYLNGTNLKDLKELMGHALIDTTLRYVHWSNVISGKVLSHTATAGMKAPEHMRGFVKMFKDIQTAQNGTRDGKK
ncbi:MAG: tyrosine-type recombinase/integrase [Verrucomicrobiae bacterium]|nr:tyrosine-type recombinase/integrase [Verrucomicrobiae bacterium]